MKRPVLVAIASLFVAGGALAGLFYETILWFNMPSATRFPIRGIDVSHHQGKVPSTGRRWPALASVSPGSRPAKAATWATLGSMRTRVHRRDLRSRIATRTRHIALFAMATPGA